jgi:hypothetical protein
VSTLLALSDVAVMRALERAYSRGLSGDARRIAAHDGVARHHAYEKFPIALPRQAYVLEDAWSFLPELAGRWPLTVDPGVWALALDRYTRSLLTTRDEHSLDELSLALTGLV